MILSPAGLDADVQVARASLRLDVRVEVEQGTVMALLGPNGSGKTTLVHALAGLLALSSGRVVCEGEVLEDRSRGFALPAHQRPMAVVFQDYRLFPHMSALDNVAYGLRARGRGGRAARERALGMLTRLGVQDIADLRAGQISGGQAQRVALARALAVEPRLLLLDEPVAALDVQARPRARAELRQLLAEFDGTAVVVTHDPADALTLADTLVVVEAGRVVQAGVTAEIAARPRTPYVADFVGLNLFRGIAGGGTLTVDGTAIAVADTLVGDTLAVLHPNAVALHRERPHGSARNVWQLRVAGVEVFGDRARVRLEGQLALVAEVTMAAVGELGVVPGAMTWAEVKATAITVYPA
ncbi:MAG: ABC transporter ATP-binding protein [Candidatus Dormibacteria bacterium]